MGRGNSPVDFEELDISTVERFGDITLLPDTYTPQIRARKRAIDSLLVSLKSITPIDICKMISESPQIKQALAEGDPAEEVTLLCQRLVCSMEGRLQPVTVSTSSASANDPGNLDCYIRSAFESFGVWDNQSALTIELIADAIPHMRATKDSQETLCGKPVGSAWYAQRGEFAKSVKKDRYCERCYRLAMEAAPTNPQLTEDATESLRPELVTREEELLIRQEAGELFRKEIAKSIRDGRIDDFLLGPQADRAAQIAAASYVVENFRQSERIKRLLSDVYQDPGHRRFFALAQVAYKTAYQKPGSRPTVSNKKYQETLLRTKINPHSQLDGRLTTLAHVLALHYPELMAEMIHAEGRDPSPLMQQLTESVKSAYPMKYDRIKAAAYKLSSY